MSETDIYGQFLNNLGEQDPQILPDNVVREKIIRLREESTPDVEKQQLRNEIIDSNIRLIPHIINRLPNRGIPPEELIGEAFETLDRCIDIWDPEFVSKKTEDSVKFSTYVAASIEAKLRGPVNVAQIGKPIKLPDNAENISNLMRRARELFMQEEEREPKIDEWYKRTVRLAGEQGRSLKALKSITPETFDAIESTRLRGMTRVGKEVGRGNVDSDTLSPLSGNIEETIPDDSEPIEEIVDKHLLEERMEEVLESLTSRERMILRMRNGIGLNEEGKPMHSMTLEQVALVMGVTRESIRQIEAKALRKLRHPSRSRKLKPFMDFPEENENIDERIYRTVIDGLADAFIKELGRGVMVSRLQGIRKGSWQDGSVSGILSSYLNEEYARKVKRLEEKMYISPRSVAKDLREQINQLIEHIQRNPHSLEFRYGDRLHKIRNIWGNARPIAEEELIENDH